MSSLGKNRRNDSGSQAAQPLDPVITKARDQIAKGDRDGAAATIRQLMRQQDLSLTTRLEAAKLLGSAGATGDATTIYLDAGRKALNAGDVATARSSFAAAHALDQKSYDALFELGRVDLAEGQRDQALEKFVEVLRKSNLRHLPALYEAAVLYEGDGQTDQAIVAYRKIAERDRHHVPTLTRLADLHRKKGQLGDALGYYLQGARAAMAAMNYKEARQLIDSALQIEDDNWEARRLQQELAKAAPDVAAAVEPVVKEAPGRTASAQQPSKPTSQPAVGRTPPPAAQQDVQRQAPAPQPVRPAAAAPAPQMTATTLMPGRTAPTAPPAQAKVITSPVQAPNATSSQSPVQPAFSGSDMNTELPPEVTLLEKQSEVTSKLAAITAEVAEAYKKRVAIERDIKAAQAALDALNSQRGAVETNISTLKRELDSVTQTKAAEDKTLEEVRSKLESSRADLERLATLPQFIKDVETKSTAAAAVITGATSAIENAQRRVSDVQNSAGSVEKAASELIVKMGAAQKQAEEAQEQLKGLLSDAKSAKSGAAAVTAAVAELKNALAAVTQTKAQVDAARNELKSLSPSIDAKRAQTAAALSQLEQKRAARDTQFQAAAAQINGTSQPAKAAPTAVPAATAKPNTAADAGAVEAARSSARPQPSAAAPSKGPKTDATKVDIDALVVAGRLDDALRAARESANGSSDPDARMIEAAERLRSNGNAAAAAKACEKLVSAGNSSSAVRYCLGFTYVDLKRFKEAMSMFDAIAEPEYGVLRENGIGLCLRGLGRTDEAAQRFSRALEIPGQPDGQYREVLYNLADLYEGRGDQESLNLSLWSFEEIQAGAPDFRDVADRIASLKDQLAKIEVPEPNPVLTRDGRGGRDSRF